MALRVPAHVAGLSPYSPGKPLEEVERELGLTDTVKLASNENPLGPSPLAVAAAREALADAHRYPEDSAVALRRRLAEVLGVPAEGIVIGAGSSELIALAARAYLAPGDEAVMATPAFVVYRSAVAAAGGRPVEVPCRDFVHDLEAMARAVTPRTRLVFVCNPNNPTGTVVTEPAFGAFVARLPADLLLVVDEAYIEYVDEPRVPDALAYLARADGRPPLLVLRTFSKIYGLAGLRVGYGVTTPEVAADLHRVRPPFNVSRPALAAAEAALGDRRHVERTREVTLAGRAYLARELARLGLTVVPSQANFVLVRVPGRGVEHYEALLREGVVVRPVDMYGLPGYLRITVGTPVENARCVAALARRLARGGEQG
ncbi:MAG TPA: histidinol-phosphate transaminase [Thermodesulfobacteriota bacterium]|nr:histidinol-phosphate transaminase [Thermodesulfobacteriota bacterium]